MRSRWFRSKEIRHDVPVQASLELVDVVAVRDNGRKADAAEQRDRTVDRDVAGAEVEIVVFGLDRPVLPDRPFDARSDGPADAVIAAGAAEQRHASEGPVVGVVDV